MNINMYIWNDSFNYSIESWMHASRTFPNNTGYNRIIINHNFKQYWKNFKCTKHQLKKIIEISKSITKGNSKEFTI